jgi:protein-tyrosine phosphatase
MDQIRPWLFIGNFRETQQISYLHAKSIDAMLQLAVPVDQPGIKCLYLPVEDFAPLNFHILEQGVSFVRDQKELGQRVLVACFAGINRSSSFCTAALIADEGLGLFDAYKEVKKAHPESMPQETLWKSLCEYFGESIPYIDMMRL